MIMASTYQLLKLIIVPSLLATFCLYQVKSEILHSSFGSEDELIGEGEWIGNDHDNGHSRVRRAADVSAIRDKHDASRIRPYTQTEEGAIVDKHREYRKVAGASNMEYMTWDDDLENTASLWASVCYWGHGQTDAETQYKTTGQNMWLGEGQPNGVGAVRAWHDNEYFNYRYDEARCLTGKVCGHYTQVLWAKSRIVGCGRAYCAQTFTSTGALASRTNVWIFVCHYYPAGNYVGVRPYLKGPPCTECTSGKAECYDNYACRSCSGLNDEKCVCLQECHNCGRQTDTCECACAIGWKGQSCDAPCENTDERCGKSPGWPSKAFCGEHEQIPKLCAVMCETCVPFPEGYTTPSGEQTCPTEAPTTVKTTTASNPETTTTKASTTASRSSCKTTCKNRGTLQTDCSCKCQKEHTGKRCERLIEEVLSGVEIFFEGNVAVYNTAFESKLFITVARVVTRYCNNNFKKCCRTDQDKKSGTFGFVISNDIQTAEGYPIENEEQNESTPQFIVMIIVKVPRTSDLCENGAETASNRRRRGVNEQRAERKRRADFILLEQSTLMSVIQESIDTIATDLNVTVYSVKVGEVTETNSGGSAMSPGAVAGIIIAVLLIVVIITVVVIILVVKRQNNLKNKTVDHGSSADKDSGDQKTPPEDGEETV